MENRNQDFPFVKLAAFAIAGYALYKGRFKIQELLEQGGVKTPWLNDSFVEGVKSGAAKASGQIKRATNTDGFSSTI